MERWALFDLCESDFCLWGTELSVSFHLLGYGCFKPCSSLCNSHESNKKHLSVSLPWDLSNFLITIIVVLTITTCNLRNKRQGRIFCSLSLKHYLLHYLHIPLLQALTLSSPAVSGLKHAPSVCFLLQGFFSVSWQEIQLGCSVNLKCW